jgi:hypothetical protein
MEKTNTQINNLNSDDSGGRNTGMERRAFFKYAGAGVAILGLAGSSCKKSADNNPAKKSTIDVGSGDTGILNYAYALEQLEAAFYTQVIATPYTGITAAETAILTDIRDHEIAHRAFYKAALGSGALAALVTDFSQINFADRTNVLDAAKGFEDLGVAAYNGVAYLIQDAVNLTIAGKIVSVEARHSAAIRNLSTTGTASPFSTFADATVIQPSTLNNVANPYNGLEAWRLPSQVLPTVNQYITVNLTATKLP